MKLFDILNRYKMDGRKRPIREGFGFQSDFVYKSRSFIGILGCKKRCNSDNVCQNQFKNADDSMIQVGTQSNKIEAYSHTHPEQGRSMVEILGVLAVIGVLTVGGIMGYRYAMATYQANEYMNNMRVAYTTINAMPKIPTEATPDILDSFKILEEDVVYYGAADSVFIEAAGVEEKVCQRLLALKTAPIRAIYTVDKDVLTEELCAVKERLLFEFQSDNPNQEVECRLDCGAHGTLTEGCTACVCAAHWGGKECDACDGEWETDEETGEECAICPEPYVVKGNACMCYVAGCAEYDENCRCLACKTDFDYVYDAETSTCIAPEKLWCEWTYEAGSKADCSFVLLSGNEEQADCAFKIEEASKSDCAFEYNESTEEMTPKGNKCGSGEYCYLKWTDETCDSVISNSSYGTIYGVCTSLDRTVVSCEHTPQLVTDSQCPKGEYCYLGWTDEVCSSVISNSSSDTIYGICTSLDRTVVSCEHTPQLATGSPCPKGEYCYLGWTDEVCSSVISNSSYDTIYGVCTSFDRTVVSCEHVAYLKEKTGCPDEQYCDLKWQQKNCSSAITNTPQNTIYGACTILDQRNRVCPIK